VLHCERYGRCGKCVHLLMCCWVDEKMWGRSGERQGFSNGTHNTASVVSGKHKQVISQRHTYYTPHIQSCTSHRAPHPSHHRERN
jgi:hypothetical protein